MIRAATIIFLALILSGSAHAQPGKDPDFYDTAFVRQYKMRSVKMYVGKVLDESYEFNSQGKITKQYSRQEEEARQYSDRPPTSRTDHRKDTQGRIVGRSYYDHEELQYTDSLLYDERGNVTHVIRTEPGIPPYIQNATTYDEHNNPVEVILGGMVPIRAQTGG